MCTDAQQIFAFIIKALEIAKAPYNIIDNELILAQCRVNVPPSFFRPARVETLNLQLVCSPELINKYPGAELVTKGSFRLQWLADGVKSRGEIFRGTYVFDLEPAKVQRQILALLNPPVRFYFKQPFLFYHPHLLVNFKVTLETDEKIDLIYSLSIDLTTGEIASNLLEKLKGKRFTLQPPRKNLEKKRIPYSEGFNALQNHLKWLLRNHDPHWIDSARNRWEQEVKFLEAYYRDNPNQASDNHGFYRQVAETYRKFRPVIRLQIINVAVLYLPVVIYTLEPHDRQLNLQPLRFDPVRRKVIWVETK